MFNCFYADVSSAVWGYLVVLWSLFFYWCGWCTDVLPFLLKVEHHGLQFNIIGSACHADAVLVDVPSWKLCLKVRLSSIKLRFLGIHAWCTFFFPYFCSLSMSCPFLCAPERSLLQYLRFMHGLDDSFFFFFFFFVTRQFLGGSRFFSLLLKI